MEKKRVTLRDFIETNEGFLFSVVSYFPINNRYLAFLRYYPSRRGDRIRKNDKIRYKKVKSTDFSFSLLEKMKKHVFSYLGFKMQGVAFDEVKKVYKPEERIKEILFSENADDVERDVADIYEELGVKEIGVTGSVLVKLHDKTSDIDFCIYGYKNFEKARESVENFPLSERDLRRVYEKRKPSIPFKKFLFHEMRKKNRGVYNNRIFDILLVRKNPIKEEFYKIRRIGKVKIEVKVLDDSKAFDYPAEYIVEGDKNVYKVVSYTHTYVGQVFSGEKAIVKGYLEEVVSSLGKYRRVIVGTSREAWDEYIVLK